MIDTTGVIFTFADGSEFIAHHGIKGMHWGIRRTPEQLGYKKAKGLRKAESKYERAAMKAARIGRGKDIESMSKRERNKLSKQLGKMSNAAAEAQKVSDKYDPKIKSAKNREDLQKEKAAIKEKYEAEKLMDKKKKILEKGDWEEVFKNKKIFTTDEIREITNRIDNEGKMKKALTPDKKEGLDRVQELVEKTISYTDTGINAYKKVKEIKGIYDDVKYGNSMDALKGLMAQGDWKAVASKSATIRDSDVESFSKRAKLLQTLGLKNNSKDVDDAPAKIGEPSYNKGKNKADETKNNSKDEITKIDVPSNTVKTETTEYGKRKNKTTVSTSIFDYDEYNTKMMQKVGKNKYDTNDNESGIKITPTSTNASQYAKAADIQRFSTPSIKEIQKAQSELNVVGNPNVWSSTSARQKENDRANRVASSSKLSIDEKTRINDLSDAATALSINSQINAGNRFITDALSREGKTKFEIVKNTETFTSAYGDSYTKTMNAVGTLNADDITQMMRDAKNAEKMASNYKLLSSLSKDEATKYKDYLSPNAYDFAFRDERKV